MEITATLKQGSFTFEIQGESREEIQEEILGLAEFVQENENVLDELTKQVRKGESENEAIQTPATDWDESTASSDADTSEFASISQRTRVDEEGCGPRPRGAGRRSQRTRVDEEVLAQLFEIPDDEEEPPFLSLYHFEGEADVLSGHRSQQQAKGSVLLLYLWKECRGIEEVTLEKLDEGLSYSNIEIERRDAMYQAFSGDAQTWFNSDGDKIQLTTPGEHRARQIVSELAEELQSQ